MTERKFQLKMVLVQNSKIHNCFWLNLHLTNFFPNIKYTFLYVLVNNVTRSGVNKLLWKQAILFRTHLNDALVFTVDK